MKMAFKIDTGELVAYGTGDVSQWSDTAIYYADSPADEVYPGEFTYTYNGTDVIQGDRIPDHDLTGS